MPLKRRTSTKQPSGGRVVLTDLDIILYQAASVCDVVSYTCIDSYTCKYKKDMVDYCHVHNLPTESITKTVTPEPLSFCLHTIKSMIHNIMDKTGADTMRGFLTGKGNYRETIDSIAPYKGNRPTEKPTHFYAAKEYLINKFDAEVVEGCEADDCMGYNQTDNTVIATLDKDLDMIKGAHYNWTKDELYTVSPDDADEFFYKQLLTGDSVDNIKGIKGIGIVRATSLLLEATTNKERYDVCLEQYEKSGQDYYDLLENGNLLWIQRERGILWTPPT